MWLLFAILAIVTGANSYRGIVTFIDVAARNRNVADAQSRAVSDAD